MTPVVVQAAAVVVATAGTEDMAGVAKTHRAYLLGNIDPVLSALRRRQEDPLHWVAQGMPVVQARPAPLLRTIDCTEDLCIAGALVGLHLA